MKVNAITCVVWRPVTNPVGVLSTTLEDLGQKLRQEIKERMFAVLESFTG